MGSLEFLNISVTKVREINDIFKILKVLNDIKRNLNGGF